MLRFASAVVVFALAFAAPATAEANPRVQAVPGLHDVAVASWDQGGPVIYVNPAAMNAAGHAARFFMQHELAHHGLGHVVSMVMGDPRTQNAWLRQGMELAADCAAARRLATQGDWQALQSAVALFSSQGFGAATPLHPAGAQRAQTIRQCAGG